MVKNLKILGVIPARFDSTRLPGKVLRNIAGKPMSTGSIRTQPVQSAGRFPGSNGQRKGGGVLRARRDPVMLTGGASFGNRPAEEVMDRIDADIYINIQGDEPTLRPDHLEAIVSPFLGEMPGGDPQDSVDKAGARNPR